MARQRQNGQREETDMRFEAEGNVWTLHEVEARHIARVFELAGGNQRRAARMLGITRWSLARRLRKLGLHTSTQAES
jgi:DNA-binding NtrC family response regulator